MLDDTKQTQEVKAKRTAKNSVFLDLFQDKKNLLKLYQTLHPEDTNTTKATLDIATIDNVLTDNLYNDLGIMVGNNRLLLEAQASWTVNILIRILLYLAQSYHEYFERTSQSLHKSKKVKMPMPELYVILYRKQRQKTKYLQIWYCVLPKTLQGDFWLINSYTAAARAPWNKMPCIRTNY